VSRSSQRLSRRTTTPRQMKAGHTRSGGTAGPWSPPSASASVAARPDSRRRCRDRLPTAPEAAGPRSGSNSPRAGAVRWPGHPDATGPSPRPEQPPPRPPGPRTSACQSGRARMHAVIPLLARVASAVQPVYCLRLSGQPSPHRAEPWYGECVSIRTRQPPERQFARARSEVPR
jgi:hypothetical protein